MAESRSSPSSSAPAATPAPKKPRKSPGPLDSRTLAGLGRDEEIIRAASEEIAADAPLASALSTHFLDRDNTVAITPASLGALLQQAADARTAGGAATSGDAAFHSVTDDEDNEAGKARAAIRGVQSRAKEKYEETDPARLAAYYVGKPLRSRSQITQAGAALYALLRTKDDDGNPVTPQDTLPGFDQARIDRFHADLGSYAEVQTAQSGARKTASTGHGSFEESCAQVSRRRRKLQLAIDAERPYTDPANTPLRNRLGLPADKTMS